MALGRCVLLNYHLISPVYHIGLLVGQHFIVLDDLIHRLFFKNKKMTDFSLLHVIEKPREALAMKC